MPIRFGGAAELIDALGGGSRIERESYGREAQRLMTAAITQASMEKRVEEAYMLSQTNDARDDYQANPSDLRDFPSQDPTQQARMLGASNYDFTKVINVLKGSQEIDQRARLEAARLGEGFGGGNAIVNAIQASPTLTPKIDVKGGIGLIGQYGDDPQLAAQAVQDALNSGSASAGQPGVRERVLEDIMRMKNPDTGQLFTREEAVRKKEFESVRVDSLGNVIAVDEFNQAADSVPLGGDQSPPAIPAPPPGGTMIELASIGTGLIPATSDIFARTVSLFGFNPDFAASQAMGQMKSMALQIINSQRQNPRFSEGERNDLMRRFNVEPGAFRSEGYAVSQLQALKQTLTTVAAQNDADAADDSLTTQERGNARNAAREARNAIALIGEIPQDDGLDTPLSGVDIDNLSDEEAIRMAEGL